MTQGLFHRTMAHKQCGQTLWLLETFPGRQGDFTFWQHLLKVILVWETMLLSIWSRLILWWWLYSTTYRTGTLLGARAYISTARKYALISEMRLITNTLRVVDHASRELRCDWDRGLIQNGVFLAVQVQHSWPSHLQERMDSVYRWIIVTGSWKCK